MCIRDRYYGASELSYVSYLDDSQMGEEPTTVGRLFPGVRADIRDGEIYVCLLYTSSGMYLHLRAEVRIW